MNSPQCERALSTVWVRVVVLARSSTAESALVGCNVGAYWRALRWRNHRSLRGEQCPTAKRSCPGVTSVRSGDFVPYLKGRLPKFCSIDDINAAQLVKTPRQAVVSEHDEP